MGKHNFMRVMINGKKLHTTGAFNKLIMEELDRGKWPDEVSYGCTLGQIKEYSNKDQTSILVTLLFYKRHICKPFRTLERVHLSEYQIDQNGTISRGNTNYSVWPYVEQRYRDDEYLRGYFNISANENIDPELYNVYLRLKSTSKYTENVSETHRISDQRDLRGLIKVLDCRYTAFYYDPQMDQFEGDSNELYIKGNFVSNITEVRTSDELCKLEPPRNKPSMQLIMIVKTADMNRLDIVNHNPNPEIP